MEMASHLPTAPERDSSGLIALIKFLGGLLAAVAVILVCAVVFDLGKMSPTEAVFAFGAATGIAVFVFVLVLILGTISALFDGIKTWASRRIRATRRR